jgi:HPt (histidine-containing phosphotransfer) domain-containing protein
MSTTIEFETAFEKIYDLDMVNRLCRGDNNLTKKMVQLFLNDIPPAIEEIKQAYNIKDFITLKKTAHRIKPVLAMYYIVKIENDIKMIEKAGFEENITPELESNINNLSSIIGNVIQQMHVYVS